MLAKVKTPSGTTRKGVLHLEATLIDMKMYINYSCVFAKRTIEYSSRWNFEIFLNLPQCKVSGPIGQLW